jgi:hypothetical protein
MDRLPEPEENPNQPSSQVLSEKDRKTRVPWWIKAGKPNPGRPFKKGHVPWQKGKLFPEMLRNKYGARLKGIPKSEE